MSKTGHSATSEVKASYGDFFSFEIELSLPAVTEADKFDANLEIFSFQPDTRNQHQIRYDGTEYWHCFVSEVGGFTICKADETARADGVVSSPMNPVKQETMNFGFASVVRTRMSKLWDVSPRHVSVEYLLITHFFQWCFLLFPQTNVQKIPREGGPKLPITKVSKMF